MGADIVNLRQARKQRNRRALEVAAEENRRLHGRPKADRKLDEALADKARKSLDGHRREDDPSRSST